VQNMSTCLTALHPLHGKVLQSKPRQVRGITSPSRRFLHIDGMEIKNGLQTRAQVAAPPSATHKSLSKSVHITQNTCQLLNGRLKKQATIRSRTMRGSKQ
jgi:hypothetical protein